MQSRLRDLAQALLTHPWPDLLFHPSPSCKSGFDGQESNDGNNCKPITPSCSTCAQLGWDTGSGSPAVCGNSLTPAVYGQAGGCDATSWTEAQSMCSSIGARLCTVSDMLNEESKTTGCGHDLERL